MKQLLYSLIIIFLLIIFCVGFVEYADYKESNYYTPQQVEQIHEGENVVMIPSSYYTFQNLAKYLFYITSAITFLLSLFYIFKNTNLIGYFKSLVIPVSFIIFSILGIVIISQTTSLFSGEGGLGVLFLFIFEGGILISSALVNLVVYFVRRN